MKKSRSLHGTWMNHKSVNQSGQKSQQLHPQDQRRGYSEDTVMMPLLKNFLQTFRPVTKYYGHDVNEENEFDLRKSHADENNSEDELEEDDDSVNADPQHKLFMENLRPEGNFYVLSISKDNVAMKYHDEISSPEPEDPTVIVIDDENHISNGANEMDTATQSSDRKLKFPKPNAYKSGNVDSSKAQKQEEKCRGRNGKGQDKSAGKNPNRNASSNRIALEPQNHALNFKGKCIGTKPKGGSNFLTNKNPIGNSNQVTSEGHDHAVKHRVKRAKKNVVPSADCPKIDLKIKENTEYDDDAPRRRRAVRASTLNEKIFLDNDDEANAGKPSEFREKLMQELKKPYCQAEYERLLKDITVRKPAEGHKVLRNRTKVCEEDHHAKSYLDHHIDLKRKIYEVHNDKHKVLNLMRGFFYWLVNVSHEWKFKPWTVQSCLDVLPQQE